MKRKVCVVITARPSYSRIKTALTAIQAHPDLKLQLVVAASALLDRYGTAVNYIERDGFNITARVHNVLEGESPTNMAKTTGLGLMELSTVFYNLQPDMVVTIADRYETLATAVAGAYMNIPVVHIQGGEVTGSIDEKVRHAVTKLSDLHLVANRLAAENVIRMGELAENVSVTGCPSIDIAAEVCKQPDLDFQPYEKYGGVGWTMDLSNGYIVVMQHPVTTEYELARMQITETLQAVTDTGFPTLWFWPNVDAGSDGTSGGIRAFREHHDPPNLHFFKNMASADFLRLLINSRGIVGNSSVGIRECAFLGVPTINIGSRQSGRQRGPNVTDVPHDRAAIRAAIETMLASPRPKSEPIYGDGHAGERIADILATWKLSYEKKLAY
ncbi:MAG: UDP-N-acetylglucosamine 2-epimerase [Acidobacteriota bacterium]|nr:UDP-N-acetylglucosamine 2-epimerase [Acidobacteriota bacterium]